MVGKLDWYDGTQDLNGDSSVTAADRLLAAQLNFFLSKLFIQPETAQDMKRQLISVLRRTLKLRSIRLMSKIQ